MMFSQSSRTIKLSPYVEEFVRRNKKFSDLKLEETAHDGIFTCDIREPRLAELKEEMKKVICQSYLLEESQYQLLCREKKEILSNIEDEFQVKGSTYQFPVVGSIPLVFQVNHLTSISCLMNFDPENIPVDSLIIIDSKVPQSTSGYDTREMSQIENYEILEKESWNLPLNHHITLSVPEIVQKKITYSWNLLFEKCLKIVFRNDTSPHTIGISIPTEISSEHLIEFCQNIPTSVKNLPQNVKRHIYILLFVKTSKMLREVNEILKATPAAKSDLLFVPESKKIYSSSAPKECTVSVIEGSITEQRVDVVVCNAANDLCLGQGQVSSALSDKAGPKLQAECKRNHSRGIIFPEIVVTNGYNLPCNKIFFGTLPRKNANEISVLVETCLQRANIYKFSSIAFPALGTGLLNYPPLYAAEQMASAIEDFKTKIPESSLKEIIIVISPKAKGINLCEWKKTFAKTQDSKGAVPKGKTESLQQNEQRQDMEWTSKQLQWIQFLDYSNRSESLDHAIKKFENYLLDSSLEFRKIIPATQDQFNQNNQKHSESSKATAPSNSQEKKNISSSQDQFNTNKQEASEINEANTPINIRCFQIKDGPLVKVYEGDILNVDVDGIVNAANRYLSHGGGVAEAIIEAAGDIVNIEGQKELNGRILNEGEVLSTSAGNLKQYKKIIHAVGPKYTSEEDEYYCKKIADTVFHSMEKANQLGLNSIALPAISSGIFGVPLDICTNGYFLGVKEFCKIPNCQLKEVHFVDRNQDTCKAIKDYFAKQLNEAQMEISGNNIKQSKYYSPNISTQEEPEEMDVDCVDDENVTCSSCKGPVEQSMNEKGCGLIFCARCTENQYFKSHKPSDIVHRNHPGGTMDFEEKVFHLLGDRSRMFYEIKYYIRQNDEVRGTKKEAYLPVTEEGKTILKMLQLAFKRYLIFTVKKDEECVSWSDIPHKISLFGNLEKDGCLSANYLNEVKHCLATKGITPDDVAYCELESTIVLK